MPLKKEPTAARALAPGLQPNMSRRGPYSSRAFLRLGWESEEHAPTFHPSLSLFLDPVGDARK
jgi:hypothetical protein